MNRIRSISLLCAPVMVGLLLGCSGNPGSESREPLSRQEGNPGGQVVAPPEGEPDAGWEPLIFIGRFHVGPAQQNGVVRSITVIPGLTRSGTLQYTKGPQIHARAGQWITVEVYRDRHERYHGWVTHSNGSQTYFKE